MLILLIDNNENEIKKIQAFLAEIFPSADIMPFSDSKRAMEFMCSDRFSIDLCFTKIMMPSVGVQNRKGIKDKKSVCENSIYGRYSRICRRSVEIRRFGLHCHTGHKSGGQSR